MNREAELSQARKLSERIVDASQTLFPGHALAMSIRDACADYDKECRDIILGRGLPGLTLALIGAKGQGKTWAARQLIKDEETRQSLPSGVLARESTTKLYWIGPAPPEALDLANEKFIYVPSTAMLDIGLPYSLLDTPGITDANSAAVELARAALALAPIQILVIRRDQLRAATTSPLVEHSDGVTCVPVVTAIPLREGPESGGQKHAVDLTVQTAGPSLASDLDRWLRLVAESAPRSRILEPILLKDFEATGDESVEGERFRRQLAARLLQYPLHDLTQSTGNRLMAASERLKHRIHRLLQSEMPQLSRGVAQLQEEAFRLPRRAVESVLGPPVVLETAIRARLRTQMVADTSSICFPYRTTLSLVCLTQGAWDRLILAMTGSIPSIFGTFVAWAKNIQQSRKADQELQSGVRDRLNGQVQDQLRPLQHQFRLALAHLRGDENLTIDASNLGATRLNGIDELQARSSHLFEQTLARSRVSRLVLWITALIGMLIFWSLMAGPIVSIYRHFFVASFQALSANDDFVKSFHYPSMPLLMSSVILSFLPMLFYTMIIVAWMLRRSKIESLANGLQSQHHVMVDELHQNGTLRLEFADPNLEKAQFLLSLDRKGTG